MLYENKGKPRPMTWTRSTATFLKQGLFILGGALLTTSALPAYGGAPPSSGEVSTKAVPLKSGNDRFFTETTRDPLSTFTSYAHFSLNVPSSYAQSMGLLAHGRLPFRSNIRVEEFVSRFKYRYTSPESGAYSVHMEAAPSPFDARRHFVLVSVQGQGAPRSPIHLVFLVDNSSSMYSRTRLDPALGSIRNALQNLDENDTVAIVTYAGTTQEVLPPTPASEIIRIEAAIASIRRSKTDTDSKESGMDLAYKQALKTASGQGETRVVVLTDGKSSISPNLTNEAILESVQKHAAKGVTLTTVGYEMYSRRDEMMEKLADKGNGHCIYLKDSRDVLKVFTTRLTPMPEAIAKDVKVQVEFNPAAVARYRLLGYEDPSFADKNFRDDTADTEELRAGRNITAMYEVELVPEAKEKLATVRVRAKAPDGTEASEQAFPFERSMVASSLEAASPDFRFALSVAATANIFLGTPSIKGWTLETVRKLAEGSTANSAERLEFVQWVTKTREKFGDTPRGD